MANALKSRNDLLLNEWQARCMESEWHFNQVSGDDAPFLTSPPNAQTVYLQYERERIAAALQRAVNQVAGELHYWPRPAWFNEVIPLSRAWPVRAQEHMVRFKHLIAFGQRGTTAIQAGAAVIYSKSDPLLLVNDVATINVATTVADDEIQLFYRVADGAPSAADARYQIEPVVITPGVVPGTKDITAHRSLFVLPSIWKRPFQADDPNQRNANAADTSQAVDFVTAVDVYRVYNDTTTAIQILAGDNTVLETLTTGDILEPEIGSFRLGDFCSWGGWCDYPMRLKVYYYSGYALQDGAMDSEFAECIISLANSFLDEAFTSFSSWTLNRVNKDLGPYVMQGQGGAYNMMSKSDAENPFGRSRGAILAYRMVVDRGLQMGGKITYARR